jgi:D-alanyl-D-alanine carboxypeptidase/D-alanyl-D-alanine-endopeptidase (penicillin-binding protein 4)
MMSIVPRSRGKRPRRFLLAAIALALLVAGPAAAVGPDCDGGHYRVRRGDTLSSIARRFQTSVEAVAQANRIDPGAILPAGKVLRIPGSCVAMRVGKDTTGSLASLLGRAIRVPGVSLASTGIVVVDLDSSSVVYSLHADAPLEPASTEKLPLAVTALQRLGRSFRTYTSVLGRGSRVGATWHGDLVLKGYGDPSLTSAGLAALAKAVRARGIAAVSGGVVGDESYFDAARTAPGWKPSFAKTESPLLSALVVNRGRFDGAAVDHPPLAAAILFKRALERAGVRVAGDPRAGTAGSGSVQIVRRASPPLSVLLAQMDTWSDNFIAEMLLKQLGARLKGIGSTAAGAAVVEATLVADDVPLGGSRIVDGSGLSTLNRLGARTLAAILETLWHETSLRPLVDTFAVAGETGTLRHRLLDVPGHALIRGKTGTTDGSSALAGFVGSRYAFVVLCNGSPVNWSAAHALQDRIARTLLAA